jgi:hypothetical protein
LGMYVFSAAGNLESIVYGGIGLFRSGPTGTPLATLAGTYEFSNDSSTILEEWSGLAFP